jgi:hypothetical protein
MIFVLLAMSWLAFVWQVTPASAGFTPPPDETPERTRVPPNRPGVKGESLGLLPVTGGVTSDLSNSGIVAGLSVGVIILLMVAISLVARQSTRIKMER